MTLCDLCTQLTEWLASLDSDRQAEDSDYGWMQKVWVMPATTHPSARVCRFCAIWMTEVKQTFHWHHAILPRFYLRLELWCFPREIGRFPFTLDILCPVGQKLDHIRFIRGNIIKFDVPNEYWGANWKGCKRVWMGATTWTDNGNNDSDIPNPIKSVFGPRFEYFSDQVRGWLETCGSSHNTCAGVHDVPLPSRVLMVQEGTKITDPPFVRLIQSRDQIGRYCALSHCWGSNIQMRPLRTTHDNLDQHLKGIPFDDLAKTFQDAIMLSIGIGIKHVWIDSLCIVQDDRDDWHQEATDMGRIYRDAALVIAASGARDSSDGLFIRETPFTMTANPVSRLTSWPWHRPFNAALLPERELPEVQYGPLYKRAWAFQERYLASRIVMFMPTSVSWSCDAFKGDDMGAISLAYVRGKTSWPWLLFDYSRKELTYKSDRLHAFRGIVNDIQRTRQDDFNHAFGVWGGYIYADLLWRNETLPNPDSTLDYLPTWSWAATDGPKVLCPFDQSGDHSWKYPQDTTKTLLITGKGTLETTGYMSRPVRVLHPGSDNRLKYFGIGEVESDFIPGAFSEPESELIDYFVICGHENAGKMAGIAVFDYGTPSTSAQCYFLASSGLTYLDRFLPTPQSNTRQQDLSDNSSEEAWSEDNDIPDGFPEESPDEYGHYVHLNKWKQTLASDDGNILPNRRLEGDDQDSSKVTSTDISEGETNLLESIVRISKVAKFVYWALLLEPTEEGTYKRVGLAMLYPHAPVALGARLTKIEIV